MSLHGGKKRIADIYIVFSTVLHLQLPWAIDSADDSVLERLIGNAAVCSWRWTRHGHPFQFHRTNEIQEKHTLAALVRRCTGTGVVAGAPGGRNSATHHRPPVRYPDPRAETETETRHEIAQTTLSTARAYLSTSRPPPHVLLPLDLESSRGVGQPPASMRRPRRVRVRPENERHVQSQDGPPRMPRLRN